MFTPAQISARALEDGTRHAYQQFYRARPRLKRFWRESQRRDPRFGTASAMAGQHYATHYRNPTFFEEPGYEARPDDLARLALANAAPAQEGLRQRRRYGRSGHGRPGRPSSVVECSVIPTSPLNGLRISEALGADIEDLDFERGHRTLKVLRKGGKHVTIPLAPRTSRVVDLYIGERVSGPIFLGAKGARMDRYAADRMVKRLANRAVTSRLPGSPQAWVGTATPELVAPQSYLVRNGAVEALPPGIIAPVPGHLRRLHGLGYLLAVQDSAQFLVTGLLLPPPATALVGLRQLSTSDQRHQAIHFTGQPPGFRG